MFCPNYKNKQVFDGFNEMIEAFGGRPMTEEEFRSPELRRARSGADYSAMEAAYITYDRNGGYFLDETPQGKPSLLFQTLLSHFNGDKAKAIVAKSNVYSDQFFNWFGDWTSEEKENVSKVVDENGEPKVVYHGSKTNITIFDSSKSDARNELSKIIKPTNFFSDDKTVADAFAKTEKQSIANAIAASFNEVAEAQVEDENVVWNHVANSVNKSVDWVKNFWLNELSLEERMDASDGIMYDPNVENQKYPVFINLRNPIIIDAKGERADKVLEENKEVINNNDEVIILNIDETVGKQKTATDYLVRNSNQIKHVENLGTFNPDDNNIYRMEGEIEEKKLKYSPELARAGVQSTFGSIADRLINNESVQSSEIFNRLLEISAFNGRQKRLAEVLKYHNIPVRLVSLPGLVLATTYTDENGNSVIAIDPDIIPQVSNKFVATLVMHEMIHALTVDALNNPTTEAAKNLKRINSEVYSKFNKLLPNSKFNRNNISDGYYVLNSEKEFVAVFMSDKNARNFLYHQAQKLDNGILRSAFRNIVNAITRFFVNRDVIKTNTEQLKNYQNFVYDYIYNKPIVNNMSDNDIDNAIKEVLNIDPNITAVENLIIKERDFLFKLNNFEKNHYEIPYVDPSAKYNNKAASYKSIAKMLNTRLLAITNSQIDSSTKVNQSQALISQIHMFNSESASKYLAITMSLQQIVPQILEDIRNLRQMEDVSNDEYIYQRHSNFEMYSKLMEDIGEILKDKDDVAELIEGWNFIAESEADKIGPEDISKLIDQVSDAKIIADEGKTLTIRILDKNLKRDLSELANRVGDEDMPDYLDKLHKIDYDTGSFQRWLGSADSARDNGLRAISNMVTEANRQAELDMEPVIQKLIKLQKNLKVGESALQLYELDQDGKTTGYLIRKYNYGAFYKDYDKFLEQLNKKLNLRPTNRVAPENEDEIDWVDYDGKTVKVTKRQYWNLERNKWLSEHCHRKKIREYYDAWAKVSTLTKKRLDDINSQIQAIYSLPGVMENGYPRYDKLDDDTYAKLKNLIFRKKLLRSKRDIFGQMKAGVDLQIAEELQQLSQDLSSIQEKLGKKQEFKRDDQAWADARAKIIEEAGGNEEYQKYLNEEENNFNYKLLNKWDDRNSKLVFKTDDEGNAEVFKAIQAEFGEPKPDYGEEYNKITEEINEILRPHYIMNGNMDDEFLSTAARNYVKELLKKQRQIKYEVTKGNKTLREKSKRYSKIFQKYIEFVDTDRFTAIKRNLYVEFGQESLELLQALLLNYGTAQYDRDLGMYKNFRPYRWYQKMQAKNVNKYMKLVPGDTWIDYSDNDVFNDTKFDEKENATMVPLLSDPKTGKKLYDNRNAYSVLDETSKNYSPTLKALYDGILETNAAANAKMTNRNHVDNYQISQVTGSFWKRMKRHGIYGAFKNLLEWIGEHLGIINSNSEEDMGWGQQAEYAINDDTGTPIKDEDLGTGTMPDGRQLNVIPQYFTKKLDDPSKLSSDLVGITLMYYKSACLYDRRSKIQNTCEAIVDMMHDRKYYTRNMLSGSFKRTEKSGDSSNTYNMARQFLDMNLYDIKKKMLFGFNIGNKRFETAKFLSTFRRYTTANNLGANPKVAVVGLFTSLFSHIINSLTGEKYDTWHSTKAAGTTLYHIAKNLFGANYVGNQITEDKLLLIHRKYNMMGAQEHSYAHTNRNKNLFGRIIQGIYEHSIYGLMSSMDFLIKSQIALSVLYSYRYIDGKFMTKNDIRNNRWMHGDTKQQQKEWLDKELKKWKQGITLYDAIKVKNNQLTVDDEYKQAYDNIDYIVKSRIEKFSEAADGMATDAQKAAITQSAIGALALIHRQYLPLTIQERFGEVVYDYDTQMYKNGHFRQLLRFAINLSMSSPLFGAALGGSVGFFMFNPLAAFALGGIGVGLGMYGKVNEKPATKDVIKNMLHMSYHNQYLMKQIFWELISIYGIKQAVQAICAWAARDDDDDDSQWKEWLAYIARAFEWEASTPYNFVDMLDNIKTASPATGTLDKLEDVGSMLQGIGSSAVTMMYYSMFPRESSLQNLIYSSETETEDDLYIDKTVKSGVYKDERKWSRTLQKLHPYHNVKEQMYGSKRKRQYIEDRVMRIDK